MKVKHICLEVKGKEIKLTIEEARVLQQSLSDLLGYNSYRVYPTYPVYPYYTTSDGSDIKISWQDGAISGGTQ